MSYIFFSGSLEVLGFCFLLWYKRVWIRCKSDQANFLLMDTSKLLTEYWNYTQQCSGSADLIELLTQHFTHEDSSSKSSVSRFSGLSCSLPRSAAGEEGVAEGLPPPTP